MKARLTFLLLAILMACNLSATSVWTGSSSMWTKGSGTEQDPYLIETAEHLAYLSEMVSAGISNFSNIHFKQMTDLDLNNLAWTPIGTSSSYPFSGNYDGGGCIIKNIYITSANDITCCSLFGYSNNASFKNIIISSISFENNDCNCAAGIIASLNASTIYNCQNNSNITVGAQTVGGIVGGSSGQCIVSKCVNKGDITVLSTTYTVVGGIMGSYAGSHSTLDITESYNNGEIYASGANTSCYAAGILGGGGHTCTITINKCYNSRKIRSGSLTKSIGSGIYSGIANVDISYCYSIGDIEVNVGSGSTAKAYSGGIAYNCKSISNSYYAGSLFGSRLNSASWFYSLSETATITNSYFLSTCGGLNGSGGTSKTLTSMKSASFPVLLNGSGASIFYQDLYGINDGYPIFEWQLPKYTITTSGDNGVVTGGGTYSASTQATLTATPDAGYYFVQWNDGNTDNPRVVTVSDDATYTATFYPKRYKIYFNAINGIIPNTGNMASKSSWYSTYLSEDQLTGYVEVIYKESAFSQMVNDCPYRSGYNFDGWYTHPIYGEKVYDNEGHCVHGTYWDSDDYWLGMSDLKLFAHWTIKPRVLFNNNYPASNHTNLFIGGDFSAYGVDLMHNRANGATTMSGTQTREISSVLVYPLENVPVDSAVSIKVYNILGSKSVSSGCGVVELVNRYKESSSPRQHLDFRLEDTSIKCKTILDGYNYLALWFYYEGDTISYSNYAFNICVEMADDLDSISAPSGFFINNGDAYGDLPIPTRLGYSFNGWYTNKDSGELITNSTIANIENAQVLYAHWSANKYTVTFDPNKGSVLTTSKQVTYDSTYGVLPIPSRKGNNFIGWYTEADGGIQITENTIVRLLADQTLYAHWEEKTYSVTAIANNDTYGTVSGSGTYAINSLVTLTAIANEHYHFVKWSDGNINATRNIAVTKDTSFIANFAKDQFTISASGTNGTFTGTGTYDYGTQITLTAVPYAHYHFVQWGDGNTNASRSITITENKTFTAVFAIDQFDIAVSAVNGNVTGGGTYDYGKQVVLTVTPNTYMQFVSWSDGNTTNPRIITVTANATYAATCSAIQYTITAKPLNATMGSVSGSGTYDAGSEVYLIATPNIGYEFTEWADGVKTNPRLITVTKTTQYVAKFAAKQFTVTVLSCDDTMGSVTGSGPYAYNTSATLTATANEGYSFQSWDDGNSDNPRTLLVTEDVTLIATFVSGQSTDVDIINSNIESLHKVLKNGQLYILRDGKTYNAQGGEVK